MKRALRVLRIRSIYVLCVMCIVKSGAKSQNEKEKFQRERPDQSFHESVTCVEFFGPKTPCETHHSHFAAIRSVSARRVREARGTRLRRPRTGSNGAICIEIPQCRTSVRRI